MATDKKINYKVQGKVKNYLGNQKTVKAPLHWQSAPNHPTTELAYITKKEKDLLIKKDLHKSLKGGVNRGPSGIISLNGWGDRDEGFADKSYGGQERPGRDVQVTTSSPHTDRPVTRTVRTKTVSPKDTFAQSWTGPKRFFGLTGGYRNLNVPGDTSQGHRSRIGGLLRGALGIVGGMPGRIASGVMSLRNLGQHKTLSDWWKSRQGGEEEEEDFTSDYRINPDTKEYEYVGGSMEDTMKDFRQKYPLDLSNANQNVNNQTYADKAKNFLPISSIYAGENELINLNQGNNTTGSNVTNPPNAVTGNYGNVDQPSKWYDAQNMGSAFPLLDYGSQKLAGWLNKRFQDGGRAGYRNGEFVDEDVNIEGPGFDVNENIEMAEGDPFQMRIQELMSKGLSWEDAYDIAAQEFQDEFAEGREESFSEDQGIASLV